MSGEAFYQQTSAEVTDTTGKEGIIVARLAYDPADPLAMNLVLITNRGPVVWTFAHDLLREGTKEVTGSGSVRIWPEPGGLNGPHVTLTLISQGQRAQIRIPQRAVTDFLAQLDSTLDDGHVQAHIDTMINSLVK